jgi:hypothetical protein
MLGDKSSIPQTALRWIPACAGMTVSRASSLHQKWASFLIVDRMLLIVGLRGLSLAREIQISSKCYESTVRVNVTKLQSN